MHKKLGKPSLLALLFCLILTWFYFGSPYYQAAKVEISGSVSEVPTQIAVRWESGYGLNGYEMNKYTLQPLPIHPEQDGFRIKMIRTGNKNPASGYSNVILSDIEVDGQRYQPSSDPLGQTRVLNNGLVIFNEIKSIFDVSLYPVHNLHLEFLTFNNAGEVQIDMAGKVNQHDLYSSSDLNEWSFENVMVIDYWFVSPDGRFTVRMEMPRYPVRTFRVDSKNTFSVSSFVIRTADGETITVANGVKTHEGVVYQMSEVDKKLKRSFHPQRLGLQILFALFTTWLLSGLVSLATQFHGLKDIFVNEKRYLFWAMFLTSFGLFSLWLLAFWPGVASTDSLKIWRAAQIPGIYLGDHPQLNVIFYQYLIHFWNNMAVVPVFQNLCTSLLIAHIFFSFYRWQLPLYVLFPCYFLTVFSLPVGLYTIILWKDIPFALLTVFLGFKLADFYFCKRATILKISKQTWIVLTLLVLAVVGVRYNGAVYLIVVPVLLVLLGIVRLRWSFLLGCAGIITIVGISFGILNPFDSTETSFFVSQTKTYVQKVRQGFSGKYLKDMGLKYLGILNVNQTKRQWDLVHNCLYGRYNNDFLRRVRWNDVYPYLPLPRAQLQKKIANLLLLLYWKSYQSPWVYFAWNPVYMLFVLPFLPLFYRKLPMTSVFSFFVIIQVAALVFLDISNWRYYFFTHLALYFLVPMIGADLTRGKTQFSG